MTWTVINDAFPLKPYVFFSRFLVGGVALREARRVSRRQIFLQGCNLGVYSGVTAQLIEAISRYNRAVVLLAKSNFSLEDICHANYFLLNDPLCNGGLIRKHPFVHKLKNNKISLPAPSELNQLLNNALNHLSSASHPVEKSIYMSAVLLGLHPFYDGNGRTARALFDAIMLKYGAAAISPFYFIFQKKNMHEHIRAVVLTATSSNYSIEGDFWDDYRDWQGNITSKIITILSQTKKTIASKTLFMPLSFKDIELINSLWLNPIVNPQQNNFSKQLISYLVNSGVLTPKRTAYGIFYSCDQILLMYDEMDDALLSLNHFNDNKECYLDKQNK